MLGKILSLGLLVLVFGVHAKSLHQLKLPWGTWEATVFPGDENIYVFKNVRFGANPERFGAPKRPDWKDDRVQNVTQPTACIQVDATKLKKPPGGKSPFGELVYEEQPQTEDCLFLDIYIPAKVFQEDTPELPVVAYIYGGGYIYGSKDAYGALYTGEALLQASNYGTIFVTGNYRLGAFGWLAGSYMESEGQPNVGLYDQALMLEWIRDFVHIVGGDKDSVSAWGMSAGAGSILHHLIREDGTRDPLFNSFAIQSPAFQWAWDNAADGQLDAVYNNFSKLADCGEKNISCLRNVDTEDLVRANQDLFKDIKQTGLFPVGPSVDGQWVKSIPALSLAEGKGWNKIKAAVISHAQNEPKAFTPKHINTKAEFDAFLLAYLPEERMERERDAIREEYNCRRRFFGDWAACLRAVIRDSTFTCNVRNLFDAYADRTHLMSYGYPSRAQALHGTDLVPLFMNETQAFEFLILARVPRWAARYYVDGLTKKITTPFRNYFASFAMSGDPNSMLSDGDLEWPVANGKEDKLSSVMKVGPKGFKLFSDGQNTKETCNFWTKIAKGLMEPKENAGSSWGYTGDSEL